jgi:hypothetical protein
MELPSPWHAQVKSIHAVLFHIIEIIYQEEKQAEKHLRKYCVRTWSRNRIDFLQHEVNMKNRKYLEL